MRIFLSMRYYLVSLLERVLGNIWSNFIEIWTHGFLGKGDLVGK